jgi:hypothetical protein
MRTARARNLRLLAILAGSLVLVLGLFAARRHQSVEEEMARFEKVKVGMMVSEVEAILGTPATTETRSASSLPESCASEFSEMRIFRYRHSSLGLNVMSDKRGQVVCINTLKFYP